MQLSDFSAVITSVSLAIAAGLAGLYMSKKKCWASVFGISLVALVAIVLINRIPFLAYHRIFSPLYTGRVVFYAYAICLPMMFGTLTPRLTVFRQRLMVGTLAIIGTGYFGIAPSVEAVLAHERLGELETWLENGICLQTTDYTCGAAAAVTALDQLGLKAEESVLAIASDTTPSWGTTGRQLADAIESLYSQQGVRCTLIWFNSVELMRNLCPVIATVKYRFRVDHYVTVLEVDDTTVLIADPLKGMERMSHDDFRRQWRFVGIRVQRD